MTQTIPAGYDNRPADDDLTVDELIATSRQARARLQAAIAESRTAREAGRTARHAQLGAVLSERFGVTR